MDTVSNGSYRRYCLVNRRSTWPPRQSFLSRSLGKGPNLNHQLLPTIPTLIWTYRTELVRTVPDKPSIPATKKCPPPFPMESADWREIAPTIFSTTNLNFDDLKAKISTDGSIFISTPTSDIYRKIQKLLLEHKVPTMFSTFPKTVS